MQEANCKTIVFSSSATVYARSDSKLTEANGLCPVNPYGHSKRMFEQILLDTHQADPSWKVSILRYFNPIGAHASGQIGESPEQPPENLMPFIQQVVPDCLLAYLFIHPITRSLTNSITRSPPYSFTHSLTHSDTLCSAGFSWLRHSLTY
eukprot:GHVU01219561.1.p2 GENE.GHVU01219561.1~~GHVU01219561.1.p2  ORF type:complete len:150 (+),score=2.99 GHVU01219561.1:965-1414(+)